MGGDGDSIRSSWDPTPRINPVTSPMRSMTKGLGRPPCRKGWLGTRQGWLPANLRHRPFLFACPMGRGAQIWPARKSNASVDHIANAAIFGGSYGCVSAGRFHHAKSQLPAVSEHRSGALPTQVHTLLHRCRLCDFATCPGNAGAADEPQPPGWDFASPNRTDGSPSGDVPLKKPMSAAAVRAHNDRPVSQGKAHQGRPWPFVNIFGPDPR